MFTLRAESDYSHAGKQFVARITGRNSKFTFEREFLGRKSGKRNDITTAEVDTEGLYECRNLNRKGLDDRYYVILDCPQLEVLPGAAPGTLRKIRVEKDDAMKIAKAIELGRSIAEIVEITVEDGNYVFELLSPSEAKKSAVAQTIDTATAECWEILQSLPEKEAKKVLAALKARVSPKPAPTVEAEPDAPAVDPVTDVAEAGARS